MPRAGNLERFSPTAHLAHAIAAQIHPATKAMARAKFQPQVYKSISDLRTKMNLTFYLHPK
jgi:hypothetical protein